MSQYGQNEPLPQRHDLRAGPLTAVLEGGDLRYVKLGGETVVLRLYAAIRDRNWNTIEPRFLSYELDRGDDGFSVRFVAENVSNDVDFEWQGSITGTPDGVITATMDGVARKRLPQEPHRLVRPPSDGARGGPGHGRDTGWHRRRSVSGPHLTPSAIHRHAIDRACHRRAARS